MATHDYVLDNATGANFRSDLNNALAAIVSNNSSSSEPSTKYAYQWWADTNEGVLKIRNSANDGWVTLLQLDGTLTLEDGSNSAPALGFRDDLNTGIFSSAADTLDITCGGTTRGSFSSSGLTVTGNVTATSFVGNIDAVDGDFDGTLEADAITVAGVALSTVIAGTTLTQAAQTNITSLGNLTGLTLSGDMTFTGDSANIVFDKSDNQFEFADNAKAEFGTGGDFEIFHNGTQNIIGNTATQVRIITDQLRLRSSSGSETYAQANVNSAFEANFDNSKKFETLTNGVQITGQEFISEGTINLEKTGAHHHRILANDSGNDLAFQQSSDTGANTNFTTYLRIEDGGNIALPNDSQRLRIGAGADLQLYHFNSESWIKNDTGTLNILNDGTTQIKNNADNETLAQFVSNAECSLFFDSSKKLETTSSGIDVTGAITVNGSALSTGGGKILQVVETRKTDTFSSSSTSFVDVTGLSVTITPSSSSSKVLIMTFVNFAHSSHNRITMRVVKEEGGVESNIGRADSSGSIVQSQFIGRTPLLTGAAMSVPINILDTPSSTNALTYKCQFIMMDGGTGQINFGQSESNSSSHARGISTIIAMEVSG